MLYICPVRIQEGIFINSKGSPVFSDQSLAIPIPSTGEVLFARFPGGAKKVGIKYFFFF